MNTKKIVTKCIFIKAMIIVVLFGNMNIHHLVVSRGMLMFL